MRKRSEIFLNVYVMALLFVIVFYFGVVFVFASELNSTSYNISNPTITSGDNMSSSSYQMGLVIEAIVGNSSSSSYGNCIGFFCGIATANNVPNDPVVHLNSSDGNNKTLQELHCFGNLTDPDGDKMNVSVEWYVNNTFNFSLEYNGSYSNGSLFVAALNFSNTTKNEVWGCGMRVFDVGISDSSFINSTLDVNITILNTLPIVALDYPLYNQSTTNRTLNFSWTGSDDDGDTLEYELNVSLVASSLCTDSDRYIEKTTLGTTSNYIMDPFLRCLWDNLDYYNWTARAHDGDGFGEWNASARNLTISSDVSVSLPVYEINFGKMNISDNDDTTDNDPKPLVIQNDGNAYLNISLNVSSLWDSVVLPDSSFTFKINNVTDGCFHHANSTTSFTNAPVTKVDVIRKLNFSFYQTACNNATIDINVSVPSDEPDGNKTSFITLTSVLGEDF